MAAVGQGAPRFEPGEPVCALVGGGGYAEYCVAPADNTLPLPAGLDAVAGAALPEALFTVWANLYDRAWLGDGERLLVHGGASGIGTAAIQLAAALGTRVFATAGSPEKRAACEALGAERCIDYREEDFVEIVLELTGGEGVRRHPRHGRAATICGATSRALATNGRLVQIATQAGHKVEPEPGADHGQGRLPHRLAAAAAVDRGEGADRGAARRRWCGPCWRADASSR